MTLYIYDSRSERKQLCIQSLCLALDEFDNEYTEKFLGDKWQEHLKSSYEEYQKLNNKEDIDCKTGFSEQKLKDFYYAMNTVFRAGFGTESKSAEKMRKGLLGLLFGEIDEKKKK